MGWKDRRVCLAVYAMYPSGTTIESLPGILIRVPLTNGVGDELVLGDGVVLEADPAGLDWPAHPAAARKTTDAIAEHHSFAHCFFIDVSYYRHPFAHNEPETGSKPRRGPRMRGSHPSASGPGWRRRKGPEDAREPYTSKALAMRLMQFSYRLLGGIGFASSKPQNFDGKPFTEPVCWTS